MNIENEKKQDQIMFDVMNGKRCLLCDVKLYEKSMREKYPNKDPDMLPAVICNDCDKKAKTGH